MRTLFTGRNRRELQRLLLSAEDVMDGQYYRLDDWQWSIVKGIVDDIQKALDMNLDGTNQSK